MLANDTQRLGVLQANGFVEPAPSRGVGRIAQRQRRAQILATTRQIIGRRGVDGFVLKEVAEVCGLSVQTVYNLVGDRSSVLAAAVNEFIDSAFCRAGQLDNYPNRFIALADLYWRSAVDETEYVRHATLDYFSTNQEYRQLIRAGACRLFTGQLIEMKRSGVLRRDAAVHTIGSRLCALAAGATFDWAIGSRSLAELRIDLVEGHSLLLRDALTPPAAERVRQWLERQSWAFPVPDGECVSDDGEPARMAS